MKFQVIPDFLPALTKRRPGVSVSPSVRFIVAHDTGNPQATARANVRFYQRTSNELFASAHIFVDDRDIIECIPALMAAPEKAWHVRANVPMDNQLFGVNANDAAIGVEYCFGSNIDADAAYARYVWVIALLCHRFEVNPHGGVVGHFFLDPDRRTDPMTGLAASRRTYDQLLLDIVTEFKICSGITPSPPAVLPNDGPGTIRLRVNANVRSGRPSRIAPVARIVAAGSSLNVVGLVTGETVSGNDQWYSLPANEFLWSGTAL